MNCEIGAKNVFYGYDGERCGVEQLALQYYADEGGGWQGTHSEGGIWMTIFGLLMWDVIFSEVCDVFQSKFQVHDSLPFFVLITELLTMCIMSVHLATNMLLIFILLACSS